ncbi:NUDIX domain-containing protein [bacterium]|nr:NUDIX domain-containing protein [bacterium]
MEYFDVLDQNRISLNYKKLRGEPLNPEEFNAGIEMWIINNNSILMTQRSKTKSHPGQWEVPGGCSQAGESIIDTVKRELHFLKMNLN